MATIRTPASGYHVTKVIEDILSRHNLLKKVRFDCEPEIDQSVGYFLPKVSDITDFWFGSHYSKDSIPLDFLKGRIISIDDFAGLLPVKYASGLNTESTSILLNFDGHGRLDVPAYWAGNVSNLPCNGLNGLEAHSGSDFAPLFERMVMIYSALAKK